ncbi:MULTISPECIES: bifunctional proline dehydrogenase/L-glutamate gamma-semialdehyde dehydrogenase [unclassified Microbacterium]|uniref:bifunctional proline dehydrogenase/L-glutamate gamma-semialdehyde dehydrogenase n=1 Tax=unclassified Microbacterium TaxID=2609290 RepID=UPI00214ACA0B|nr:MULTISPECIES: bifunctional proline dehydrogenase/L-glutamate gamma-semialdehyde dehydrogenase [unclassified Microbacterium]MCR2808642.1 bifunctional proline dehydrogenase/L-glutamate gamma-semialdehyde dehydrogenase [Microbacterium sp. zg.B185]WIM18925.1 bifunctional proline dehydrogenase/L-glutamate gamma-semialdehyde dehydrogenase [Microbacterium sp. zg-B185]
MHSTPVPPTAPADTLADRAIELARRWVAESAQADVDPAAARLAGVLKDPSGLTFTIGFVDGVMRPESLVAAASNLSRVAPLVPKFLPWYLRRAVQVGGVVAPVLPAPVVPLARRALREMVGHLVVDARPDKLGPAIARIRESGARLNLNLLGEAVLGEQEALRRLEGIHELIRRPDVDYVSVKVSAIASHISMWAFDELVDEVVERLKPLYLTAASPDAADGPTFINLDMEEYRDLDLTIAVFTRILEDPRLRGLEAGIVLQAYLPDALPALEQLTAWARMRVESGGARIKIRLVKGANLAVERVDAVLHDWPQATFDSKLDSDANYLRCLDVALRPEHTAAVRIGVAGHNLFDIAYAWLLAGQRGVRDEIDVEMLLGMAQGQVQAVAREVGQVLLYVPVVRPDEFDVAISYLVRRLEENASSENFLSAAFELAEDPALFDRERDRFVASIARSADPSLRTGPNRSQDRTRPPADHPGAGATERLVRGPAGQGTGTDGTSSDRNDGAGEEGPARLTQAVLGIGRPGSGDGDTVPIEPSAAASLFGGAAFVETAVYASREADGRAAGAPGFRNAADSDPSLAANREWSRGILDRIRISRSGAAADPEAMPGSATIAAARITDSDALENTVARVRQAAEAWGAQPASERAAVLEAAARSLEARRGELIEVAASETGKVFAEADVEVSEAVDFAAYYAATARELDRVSGAVFVPSRLTVVTPPWNFPIAIPAGGVLAALAAGSGVVFKPAPQARRCAAVVAEALWDAGVPRDVLALVDIDEGALGERLVSHPHVDRVILTGSWETAALFRSWRTDLPLLAETSGKNAMIVMPSADLDLAAADLVKSAFGHAGQKCSAASLAILVGPVGRSKRFARQLVDAATSLRIGPPSDPMAEVGPVIEPPQGKLAWALTTLEEGEHWLVEPRPLDEGGEFAGRLWSPGIRTGVQPGSRFHREEFFGPVLGVMHAHSLAHAIRLQNAVAYGLTAGLYTQNPDDLAAWLSEVEAGNLYVNRGITGAIVQRQPFGGWKRSSVGAGAKAGGPNYLIGLGSWRPSGGAATSATLHLRGLDSRITTVIEAAQPSLDYESFEWLRRGALSDALAWDREFGQVRDVSHLGVERNLFRYRPLPVAVRATADASWQALLRVVVAGLRAGSEFTLSAPVGLPAAVRRSLSDQGAAVFVETEEQWLERMVAEDEASGPRPPRARLVGPAPSASALHRALADAVSGDPDLAIYSNEVTTSGRLELLPFLHEQSITITAHRFGNPDAWSEQVI